MTGRNVVISAVVVPGKRLLNAFSQKKNNFLSSGTPRKFVTTTYEVINLKKPFRNMKSLLFG